MLQSLGWVRDWPGTRLGCRAFTRGFGYVHSICRCGRQIQRVFDIVFGASGFRVVGGGVETGHARCTTSSIRLLTDMI